MIRVLQVVTDMNMGGIESFLMNLYRNVDREAVQFDFLMHRKAPSYFDEEILALGGRIHRLPPIHPKSFLHYRMALTRFFREHPEYRIIHAHNNAYSMFVLREAKRHGVPVRVAHSHCAYPSLGTVKRITYDYCISRIDRYITQAYACSTPAGQWLYSGAPFEVFPNAIDAQKFRFSPEVRSDLRRELGLGDAFTVMHVGRFDNAKNQGFLLEAFALLHREAPDAKLVLIGDGPMRSALQERAATLLPADAVLFPGIRSDVADLLQAADIFAFPSKFEGLPVTVIEAQAAGLRCVKSNTITDEVCVTDLVTSLPIDDPKAWAEELLHKRGMPHRDTYREIAQSGYDIQTAAEKLTRFYLNGEAL